MSARPDSRNSHGNPIAFGRSFAYSNGMFAGNLLLLDLLTFLPREGVSWAR